MKPWQLGFELDRLATLAAPFKRDFKPFIFGAFGLPKERDIAIHLQKNEVVWSGDPIDTVAIVKRMASNSSHEDFCGRKATLKAGDLYIKAIAGPIHRRGLVVSKLADKSKASTVWVECFAEDASFVSLLSDMGFVSVMTKIPASSELKLMMVRGDSLARMPAQMDGADIPALKIIGRQLTSEQLFEIRHEIEVYEKTHTWEQHYSSYNKRQSWTAFSLKGYVPNDPNFIIKPAEMSRKWKEENKALLKATCDWTISARHFPKTLQILGHVLPGEKQRVRFMQLSPGGGELTRHADITDPEAGTAPGKVSRLHIPITTNPHCLFRSWGLDGNEIIGQFPEGQAFYLDTRKPHSVTNKGISTRIHLVADVFAEDWLREALRG